MGLTGSRFGISRQIIGFLALALFVACSDPGTKTAPSVSVTSDAGADASRTLGDDSQGAPNTTNPNSGHTPVHSTTTPNSSPAASNGTGTGSTTSAPSSNSASPAVAAIKAQLSTPKAPGVELLAFRAGAASAAAVDSLKYFIRSIQVCESLEPRGSGFQNPSGCLELYSGDQVALSADPSSDLIPLADAARGITDGYVDLLSENGRGTLTRSTALEPHHVRTYHYGIVTWALPVKVSATVTLGDGSQLFTHDGVTTSEIIGSDNFRNYFTRSATSLLQPPAEEAVVLLGNGGNWFKFQQGFEITNQDIEQGHNWVLDLVFNPDGIIKGYENTYVNGNLREEDNQGTPVRGFTVPMIDLVPVPHREADHVVRESYVAPVDINGNVFEIRVELYSRENDVTRSILGVDVKTLVTTDTTEPPPEAAKVASVGATDAGELHFGSFNDSQIIGDFVRLEEVGDRHRATFACATHSDRAGAEGGALIVVSSCPAPTVEVEFELRSRSRLDQSNPLPTVDSDAGVEDPTHTSFDASTPSDAAIVPDSALVEADVSGFHDAAHLDDASAVSTIDASFDAAP